MGEILADDLLVLVDTRTSSVMVVAREVVEGALSRKLLGIKMDDPEANQGHTRQLKIPPKKYTIAYG